MRWPTAATCPRSGIPGQGIRATVIGAAQFSVQISGNTILIADPDKLPLQNLPVLSCSFALDDVIATDAVAADVRAALARADFEEGESPVALSFPWPGDPSHARCTRSRAASAPRCRAPCRRDAAGAADRRRCRQEPRPRHPPRDRACADVIAIDGVQLKEFDYVDIGSVIALTNVVPIIIKSLLFK
jgi:ethanolamine utilization protein EutA